MQKNKADTKPAASQSEDRGERITLQKSLDYLDYLHD